ncbi:hypothetical protein E4U25_006808 [Claviceps purpurea]|nr:hypothetical protein E4U25_006808 [Claviceps purpurea]
MYPLKDDIRIVPEHRRYRADKINSQILGFDQTSPEHARRKRDPWYLVEELAALKFTEVEFIDSIPTGHGSLMVAALEASPRL